MLDPKKIIQELENLGIDGESFLSQFLEFLLDRSFRGDKTFDALILPTAELLSLRLPLSSVTSALALLQVKVDSNCNTSPLESNLTTKTKQDFESSLQSSKPSQDQENSEISHLSEAKQTNKQESNLPKESYLQANFPTKQSEVTLADTKEQKEIKEVQKQNQQTQELQSPSEKKELKTKAEFTQIETVEQMDVTYQSKQVEDASQAEKLYNLDIAEFQRFLRNLGEEQKTPILFNICKDLGVEDWQAETYTLKLSVSKNIYYEMLIRDKKILNWYVEKLEKKYPQLTKKLNLEIVKRQDQDLLRQQELQGTQVNLADTKEEIISSETKQIAKKLEANTQLDSETALQLPAQEQIPKQNQTSNEQNNPNFYYIYKRYKGNLNSNYAWLWTEPLDPPDPDFEQFWQEEIADFDFEE